jgi:hypothetical protein
MFVGLVLCLIESVYLLAPESALYKFEFWLTSVIPALGRQWQEVPEFKISLGGIGKTCLKKRKKFEVGWFWA